MESGQKKERERSMKERYHISGMTCSACSSHVEKAVNKLAGIEKASVNLLTETMEVSYDEEKLGREEIISAVEKAGYGASLIIGGAGGKTRIIVDKGGQGAAGAASPGCDGEPAAWPPVREAEQPPPAGTAFSARQRRRQEP